MTLRYGFVKSRIASDPVLKPSQHDGDTQYHLHFRLMVDGHSWDVAVNVGTSNPSDLLKFKLVSDFRHPVIATLGAAAPASHQELTDVHKLPALDFMRSDLLAGAGRWRDSDVMDGSEGLEPVASLKRLLIDAKENGFDVYVFGRFFKDTFTGGARGIHDVHMNQGSTGRYIHHAGNDHNDHNDVWQDGALFVDAGQPEWAVYAAAFGQQLVPTDGLGNPKPGAAAIA